MSTDVFIYVNKKENSQPCGRYYLGGTSTRQALGKLFNESETVIDGFSTLLIPRVEGVKNFIEINHSDFYSDNAADVLTDDYLSKKNADDFSYWLVFEY